MDNSILALTCTIPSCGTSKNLRSYLRVKMCYMMSFKTTQYNLDIYFFFGNTFGLRCATSSSEYLSLCFASL